MALLGHLRGSGPEPPQSERTFLGTETSDPRPDGTVGGEGPTETSYTYFRTVPSLCSDSCPDVSMSSSLASVTESSTGVCVIGTTPSQKTWDCIPGLN